MGLPSGAVERRRRAPTLRRTGNRGGRTGLPGPGTGIPATDPGPVCGAARERGGRRRRTRSRAAAVVRPGAERARADGPDPAFPPWGRRPRRCPRGPRTGARRDRFGAGRCPAPPSGEGIDGAGRRTATGGRRRAGRCADPFMGLPPTPGGDPSPRRARSTPHTGRPPPRRRPTTLGAGRPRSVRHARRAVCMGYPRLHGVPAGRGGAFPREHGPSAARAMAEAGRTERRRPGTPALCGGAGRRPDWPEARCAATGTRRSACGDASGLTQCHFCSWGYGRSWGYQRTRWRDAGRRPGCGCGQRGRAIPLMGCPVTHGVTTSGGGAMPRTRPPRDGGPRPHRGGCPGRPSLVAPPAGWRGTVATRATDHGVTGDHGVTNRARWSFVAARR